YFLPSQEPEAEATPQTQADEGVGGAGVVISKPSAFTFEPSGGFGMASGNPTPSTTEPFAVLDHEGKNVRSASYNADSPPTSEQERQQWLEAVRQDDFLHRLDEEPEDEALDGAEFQRRLEAAEASLTA